MGQATVIIAVVGLSAGAVATFGPRSDRSLIWQSFLIGLYVGSVVGFGFGVTVGLKWGVLH